MVHALKLSILSLTLIASFRSMAFSSADEIETLKSKIILTAKSFEGKPDPDFKIQNQLEPLVKKLLKINPQPPVKDRLPLLYGTWKQVWGPYDYRNDDRGIDPTIGIKEIYQSISKDGYYYNISPIYKNGDLKKERIGYLKGEYKLSSKDPNALEVKFKKYLGMDSRPLNGNIFDYVLDAENDTLPNQTTIVPTLIVRIFFGGGALREVYTDNDLRILYGANSTNFEKPYLYIMTKAE